MTRRGRVARGLHVAAALEPPAAAPPAFAPELALAPYVPTAPHVRTPPPQPPRLCPEFALPMALFFRGLVIVRLASPWFAPIVLKHVLLFALVSDAICVVSDPGLLLSGSVRVVQLGPHCMVWDASRLAEQLFNETAARVR